MPTKVFGRLTLHSCRRCCGRYRIRHDMCMMCMMAECVSCLMWRSQFERFAPSTPSVALQSAASSLHTGTIIAAFECARTVGVSTICVQGSELAACVRLQHGSSVVGVHRRSRSAVAPWYARPQSSWSLQVPPETCGCFQSVFYVHMPALAVGDAWRVLQRRYMCCVEPFRAAATCGAAVCGLCGPHESSACVHLIYVGVRGCVSAARCAPLATTWRMQINIILYAVAQASRR